MSKPELLLLEDQVDMSKRELLLLEAQVAALIGQPWRATVLLAMAAAMKD